MDFSNVFYLDSGWSTSLIQSLLEFLPKLAMAVVIWIIFWFIAKFIRKRLTVWLKKVGLDTIAKKAQVNDFLANANFNGGLSKLIGDVAFWIIYLVGIDSAFETVWLDQISDLITSLINYIPNLFIAVIILLVWAFIARFVKDLSDGAVATAKMEHSWIGHVVYVIIMMFAIVTALKQAQVDISFLTDNINTIVMWIMLALWLAFGLWGKDKAKELIEKYIN